MPLINILITPSVSTLIVHSVIIEYGKAEKKSEIPSTLLTAEEIMSNKNADTNPVIITGIVFFGLKCNRNTDAEPCNIEKYYK